MARILIGNIKGPQGEQGPQGVQGPVGPQGPQGPLPPLVNNALATEAGVAALDAAMGKTLQDQITNNKNDITQLNSKLAPVKRNLTWQSTVSEIGASYSLKFGNCVYVHAGFTTVSGLSAGNDLTMLIGSGAMQTINNIAAISDKGEIGVFRVNETNLQADGTIPSGHAFILDLVIPLQS